MSYDDGLRAAIRTTAARGAQLLFADRAPSVFNDFAFGLSEAWFAGSQSPEFPVGQLGTLQQVEDILATLGFGRAQLEEQVFPEGVLITAAAASDGHSEDKPAVSASIRRF